jgi:hypothetical protein
MPNRRPDVTDGRARGRKGREEIGRIVTGTSREHIKALMDAVLTAATS